MADLWKWALGGAGAIGAFWGVSKMTAKPPPPPQTPAPSATPPTPTSITPLTSYLAPAFFKYLKEMEVRWQAKGAKTNADDFALMCLVESGCRAKTPNPIGCLGLNQICPTKAGEPLSGLQAVGFHGTAAEYLALPEEQQMVFVEQFFNNGNHFSQMRDVGSLYLVNFSPKFLGADPHTVMYRADDPKNPKTGKNTYDLNRGVDFGNKGFIEVDDMRKFMLAGAQRQEAKYNELRFRLASVGKTGNV